jgi:hypothetical protein
MQMFVPAAELLNLEEADLLSYLSVNWTTAAASLTLASNLGVYLLLCEYSLNIQIDNWTP